ncbi:hypothetical protein HK414_10245 [Ramlibacter terrae]|uniref:Uncharacterized protein n=1 Tax=Ramlibacter terrae TaxID=2732511 RepID=A0ABX6P246_9BURK|nr:hypothetical protein HK414_10245 [Ramlibacter terrae]
MTSATGADGAPDARAATRQAMISATSASRGRPSAAISPATVRKAEGSVPPPTDCAACSENWPSRGPVRTSSGSAGQAAAAAAMAAGSAAGAADACGAAGSTTASVATGVTAGTGGCIACHPQYASPAPASSAAAASAPLFHASAMAHLSAACGAGV